MCQAIQCNTRNSKFPVYYNHGEELCRNWNREPSKIKRENMASLVTDYCTLCNDDGTSTEAVRWCIECEVFLCTDCEKHHKKSRSSKAHNTMSTKDYHNLPKFMQEIKKNEMFKSVNISHSCDTVASDGQTLVISSLEKSTIVNLNDMTTEEETMRGRKNQ
ncbi:unnamed protein product [Mytilus edulis]|uniref:B box-type domain-containing protein n=1 Tax=Mytilus edulis TaxID=6550 RepID=A0A8S3TGG8_MYTED|nr:unnamed protein product [Mytilus edulis]